MPTHNRDGLQTGLRSLRDHALTCEEPPRGEGEGIAAMWLARHGSQTTPWDAKREVLDVGRQLFHNATGEELPVIRPETQMQFVTVEFPGLLSRPTMPLVPGSNLGRYEIVSPLDDGRMGKRIAPPIRGSGEQPVQS